MLKIVGARGNYRACGFAYGTQCRESIAYRLQREISVSSVDAHRPLLLEIHERITARYPEFVQELEGIAAGSECDYWRLLLLNTPEITERSAGCTSIAVTKKDEIYLVHNEDGEGDERAEDCVLLHYLLPDVSFYAFTYAGEIAGGSYSWNSHGLYLSVNYLTPLGTDLTSGVSRNFVARKIIESSDIEVAIRYLNGGGDMSGYHYYIGQGTSIYSIENYKDAASAREVVGIDVHSNHYLHPQFTGRTQPSKHSDTRLQRAQELVGTDADPLSILGDRAHAPLSICTNPNEALHTISTIGFYPRDNAIILYEPGTLAREARFSLNEDPGTVNTAAL